MTIPDEQTLLPCPFCGDAMRINHDVLQHVNQEACIIGQMAWGHGAAQKMWNTRAAIAAMPDTKALEAADRLAETVSKTGYRIDHNGVVTLLEMDGMIPINKALTTYRAARGGKA